MPTALTELVRDIQPDTTILMFGAGSSLPSGAPSVDKLLGALSHKFQRPRDGFNLAELTQLIEQETRDRRRLIGELRSLFTGLRPTAGLLNVPLYQWKGIYTTNYDNLIEQSYIKRGVQLDTVSCSFDFGVSSRLSSTRLFKLHGTIEKDISYGDSSRIIITENDYDHTDDYREKLFDTLKADLSDSDLIIIGHSLSDADVKQVITRAITLNSQAMSSGRISLLMYEHDYGRASLYEGRGLRVAFGGIDDFFLELAKKSPGPLFDYKPTDSILDMFPVLLPTVIDVAHQIETGSSDISRIFNGWPASYSDINKRLTFDRSVAKSVFDYVSSNNGLCAALLGASGVGKTTALRQVMSRLRQSDILCWEHNDDHSLIASEWLKLAASLKRSGRRGVLFIDEAHGHLRDVNEIIDSLVSTGNDCLFLLLASNRNTWRPRVKSPNIYKNGKIFNISRLNDSEIDGLLSLIDATPALQQIIEGTFSGFSRIEKRRRLINICEADMFVCMRNIFASESYDNIILREYNELADNQQDIYRLVSALETSGVRVHRQLIIRLLGIPMPATMALLENLTDIVQEYVIDNKKHVYGWKGRHPVISGIITKYKYKDMAGIVDLFELIIDNTLPTYNLEVRSIIDLCNIDSGIPRISDKEVQNRLLRKIVSLIPGHRVPRHRLIRNLTDLGHFDQAQTEIRIFEKDFSKSDAPVARLKVQLTVARATESRGLTAGDRLVILDQAREQALLGIRQHPQAKAVFAVYCEVGFRIRTFGGSADVFKDAMKRIREAERRLCDPDIGAIIRRYERMESGLTTVELLEADDPRQTVDIE